MSKKLIERVLQEKVGCKSVSILSGSEASVLNRCITCATDQGTFFVKYNNNNALNMYQAEAYALDLIAKTKTVRVPEVFYCGEDEGTSLLIMEYIDLQPHTPKTQELLGHQLALLHSSTRKNKFGFDIDNTIGITPQINEWSADWTNFFGEHRLGALMNLVQRKVHDDELVTLVRKLIEKLPNFFEDSIRYSSLLHGDLWSGNTAADADGNPVVFDPASYYGHDECDFSIAMMFGGFHQSFFFAYHEVIPTQQGFEDRNLIYQLYHYLNHYLLFGSSYRTSCMSIVKKLVCTD